MVQPPGFETHEESHVVHRLKKTIFGLKQSQRAWFDKLSIVVARYELKQNSSDHSIFVRHTFQLTRSCNLC